MYMQIFLESQTLLDPSISDGEYSVYIRITNLYFPALWKTVTENISICVILLAFHLTYSIYFPGYSRRVFHPCCWFVSYIPNTDGLPFFFPSWDSSNLLNNLNICAMTFYGFLASTWWYVCHSVSYSVLQSSVLHLLSCPSLVSTVSWEASSFHFPECQIKSHNILIVWMVS